MWAQKSLPGGSMIQPASPAHLTPSDPRLAAWGGHVSLQGQGGTKPERVKERHGCPWCLPHRPHLGWTHGRTHLRTSSRVGCSLVLSHPEQGGAWTWWHQTQLDFDADLLGDSSPCSAQLRPLCILAPSSNVCTTPPGWPLLSSGDLAPPLDRENRSPQTSLTSSILSSFSPVSIIIPTTDNAYGLLTMKSLHVLLYWTLTITWWWRHQNHSHITGKEPEGHRGWDPCPRPHTRCAAEPACDHEAQVQSWRFISGPGSYPIPASEGLTARTVSASFRVISLSLPIGPFLEPCSSLQPVNSLFKNPGSLLCLLSSLPILPFPSLPFSLSLSHFLLFQTSLCTKVTGTHGAHFPTSTD